ncbi:DUF4398 domain-containing protein, partial [Candidatus Sumerlaeota bacterium]|nr:DUF4398 domain-containing protein [Candidatus Sumerlaeota bacterium]
MRGRYRVILNMRWLILLLCVGMLVSGCTKQRAKMALNKAKKVLSQAERQEAEKYKPDLLEQTRSSINEADSHFQGHRYARSLEVAKRAVELAKKTLEESKIKRAADKLNQAKRAIDVANTNDGSKEDSVRYKKIIDLYKEAQAKRNKNKWDDVIQLSEEVIHEVEILLQRLKNMAERKLSDAQNALKSLKAEGAESYAPESVIEVTDLVNKVEKLIKVNQDYITAQNTANYAIRKAEEGVIKTKARKSQEKIKKIESDLALAITKGAEIYAPDMLEKVKTSFESMMKDYFTKNYDRVLMASPLLEHDVQQLLETTKRKAAEARMKAVEQTIRELVEGGAREYLPGRVEVIEQKLAEAKQKFEQKQYEDAETIALLALDEGEKIRSDFNDLALDAMRNATEALNIAQDVFEQMERIFIIKPLPTMTPLEREFENSKETLKAELRSLIQNARVNLGIAQLRQENGQYRRSIELSSEVRKSALTILNETYHVVAHNAIMELAQKISEYERNGGREYAPIELEKTKKLLANAKEILAEGRYKDAVSKSAETRAQMEVMVQTIEKKAVEYIKEAKQKLAEAGKYQADKYRKAELLRTRELLDEAEKKLKAQELKPAVQKAFAAAGLISSALTESTKLWAQEEITLAETKILRAEEAGADDYASELLDESRKLLEAAKKQLKEKSFLDAKNLAEKAKIRADDALYKKVHQAEDLITEAKSYGGWEREFELLSKASENAELSRKLIEKRDYISSRLYAEKAIKIAYKALNASKLATFNERVAQIRKTLNLAINSGANYFQPEKCKKITASLGKIESEFNTDNFDYYRKELDKVDAELNNVLSTVPESLNAIVAAELKRLENIATDYENIQPGKVEQVRSLLKYTIIDFNKGKYNQAYLQLKESDRAINKMETILAEERYIKEATQL